MNIVLCTDSNFVEHCGTTLMSIVDNNKRCHFYIITDGLIEKDIRTLKGIALKNGSTLDIVPVDKRLLEKFPMPQNIATSHISIATYYRLFLSELLPHVDKLIYLDCDIIVRHSLEDLWNVDLNDYALGAVYQICDWNVQANQRLGIPIEYGYFNAGVLLINLTYWRNYNYLQLFLDYIEKNRNKIVYHDQDVLNYVAHTSTLMLPCKWNMLSVFFYPSVLMECDVDENGNILRKFEEYKKTLPYDIANPAIIHFVSRPKPWNIRCRHPWLNEFIKYRKKAGFRIRFAGFRFLLAPIIEVIKIIMIFRFKRSVQ